jgi:SPP1 family phage portal protein
MLSNLWHSQTETMVRNSFQGWLHKQENHQRLQNYREYDDYYNGHQEVNIPKRVQEAFKGEFGTVTNHTKPAIDITVQMLCGEPVGIEVTDYTGAKSDATDYAERYLYHTYKQNELLYAGMVEALRIVSKKGDMFIKLYVENGQIKISVLRPDIVFPMYRDDNYKEMVACAIKWYDLTEEGNRAWKAQVFRPDVVEYYDLGERTEDEDNRVIYSDVDDPKGTRYRHGDLGSHNWEPITVVQNPLGFIPVVHTKNTIDDGPYGVSDLHVMMPLQDALNSLLTDLVLSGHFQAFQRSFLFGAYSDEEIAMDPGAITLVPGETGSLQTIQPANMISLLQSIREVVDQICTVTQIPEQAFRGFAGVPISGRALQILFTQLTAKCKEKVANVQNGLGRLNRMILYAAALLGMGDWNVMANMDTKVHFTSGLPKDKLEDAQYYNYHVGMGTMSRYTVMQREGIENVEEEILRINAETPDQEEAKEEE